MGWKWWGSRGGRVYGDRSSMGWFIHCGLYVMVHFVAQLIQKMYSLILSLKTLSRWKKYLSELLIICQISKSEIAGLWRKFIKKELDIMRSKMRLHLMINNTPQNVHNMFLSSLWNSLAAYTSIMSELVAFCVLT